MVVQTISLVLFIGTLAERHHWPVLRQLYYVLHTNTHHVVALMCAWSLIVLVCHLEHVGNDYTFQFD